MAKKSKIMPLSHKYKKVKRPTILVKRNQMKRKSISKPRNLLYEKLKANNNALARALSKEKQDHQYTFSHSLTLTSQIQDMQVAINKRDEILSKILQNSKQGLELLVKATGFLTDTIQSCRTIVQTDPIIIRTSLSRSPMPRRDSSRQSVVKSPARGVVQPMVSGHTITKPVINLSRINMPRIRTSPNLSDIEESMSTPERSSLRIDNNASSSAATTATVTNSTAASFVRLPANQQNGFPTRRVERLLPERIRMSTARISDEVDDLSENNASRRSKSRRTSRYSRRESRNSERLSVNHEPRFNHETLPEMLKSPRVALQDVSRFLRNNAQTVNVKTIFENDNTSGNLSPMEISTTVEPANDENISVQNDENSENVTEKLSDSWTAPTYGFDSRKRDSKKPNNRDDPLEGSSWMHTSGSADVDDDNSDNHSCTQADTSLNVNPSETFVMTPAIAATSEITTHEDQTVTEEDPNDSSRIEWAENRCTISSTSSDSEEDCNDDGEINYSKFLSVNTRNRKMNYVSDGDNNNHNKSKNISKYSSTDLESPKNRKFSTHDDNDGNNENEVDEDDDEKCGNWAQLAASVNTRTRKTDDSEVNNDNNHLLRISSNVTVERGRQPVDSDEDFTMIIKKRPCPTRNLPFDINELNLPVLERPFVETPQVEPEPEFTTEINMITRVISSPIPRRTMKESFMDNSTVLIPQINETLNRTSTEMDRLDNTTRTSGESFIGQPDMLKRKRINKLRLVSSSDSEPSSPLETVSKFKRKNAKKKDPSTAKVVLEKLEESKKIMSVTSRASSNSLSSIQVDQQSDSDSSNASSKISGRPRRRKAPTNLREPRLGTKLRRH